MKLILHIGNHKTGSTAIQTSFSLNEKALADSGILYPETGRIKNAHHLWSLNMRRVTVPGFKDVIDIEELIVQLQEEISVKNPNIVFMSSEEFFPANINDYSNISKLFDLFDSVEVVCVLRNQVEHIESGYKFSVLWELISEKSDFNEYLESQLTSGYHNYYEHLEKYINCKYFAKTLVLDFSDLISDRKLIFNFLKAINLEFISLNEIDNNKSLSRLATIGIALYNKNFMSDLDRAMLVQNFETVLPGNRDSFYLENTYTQVKNTFEKSNQKLFDVFGVNLNESIPIFESNNYAGPYIRPRDIALLFQKINFLVERSNAL